jgi:PleD family two-component response regulator
MDATAPRTKILLAVGPDKTGRMQRVLSGHDVRQVDTCNDARAMLENEEFGLVILGVHFDESQMFSLLGDIRAHAAYRKVPILCVLGEKGRVLSDVAIEGLDHAIKAMTANGFLNLENIPDEDEGNARIRRIVDYLILIDGDLQQIAANLERQTPSVGRLLGEPRRRAGDRETQH